VAGVEHTPAAGLGVPQAEGGRGHAAGAGAGHAGGISVGIGPDVEEETQHRGRAVELAEPAPEARARDEAAPEQLSHTTCTKDPMKRTITEKSSRSPVLAVIVCRLQPPPAAKPVADQEEEDEHRSQKKYHRKKALKRAAVDLDEERTSAGDSPRTPLTEALHNSPAGSEEEAQGHPPTNHESNSHPSASSC